MPGHRGGLPGARASPTTRCCAGRTAGPSDKNPRFEAVARGTTPAGLPPLEVVAFVGDNILDFPGQSQALRKEPDEAFAAFGARFFVLPNPMYGSWEKN